MKNTIQKIWRFYVDGFRGMTLGKTLWLIILGYDARENSLFW